MEKDKRETTSNDLSAGNTAGGAAGIGTASGGVSSVDATTAVVANVAGQVDAETTGAAAPVSVETKPKRGVAPVWHTLLLVVFLLGLSALDALAPRGSSGHHSQLPVYLDTMAMEFLLVLYVGWGVWLRGGSLPKLIGGNWSHIEDVLLDVAIAAGSLLAWLITACACVLILEQLHLINLNDSTRQLAETKRQLAPLIPHSTLEMLGFVGVSLTAGFCEEIIYRGYLQQQLAQWTRRAWIALPLAAICFGLSHGYEGAFKMFEISLLGLSFGLIAYWRKSLRPSMIAHCVFDTLQGLMLWMMAQ